MLTNAKSGQLPYLANFPARYVTAPDCLQDVEKAG